MPQRVADATHLLPPVAEDHAFSLDPCVSHPMIARQDALPFHALAVTSKSLFDAIGPAIACASQRSRFFPACQTTRQDHGLLTFSRRPL